MRRPAPFRVPTLPAGAPAQMSDHIAPPSKRPKAAPGTPEYKPKVAEPVMAAIDDMPAAYRALVHKHDFINVYHAWKQGWSVERIEHTAGNGRFNMPGL